MGLCLFEQEFSQVSAVLLPLQTGRVYILELVNTDRSVRKIVLE